MDYIREELLRQRAAWAALLLGQPVQEALEAERRTYGGNMAEDAAVDYAMGGPTVWEQAAGMEINEAERRWTAVERQEELFRRAAMRGDSGADVLQISGRAEMSVLQSDRGKQRNLPAGQTDLRERVELTVLRPDREETQGAKRLSRIYQRDARRYDGGFALY